MKDSLRTMRLESKTHVEDSGENNYLVIETFRIKGTGSKERISKRYYRMKEGETEQEAIIRFNERNNE